MQQWVDSVGCLCVCGNNNHRKSHEFERGSSGCMGRIGGGRGSYRNNINARILIYEIFKNSKIILKMEKLNSGNKWI